MKPIAIVGAGITGLTAGFYLQQRGIPVDIYEASDRSGGMISSSTHGGFLTELGPNTIMTNSAAVPKLIHDLNLESRRVLPSPTASTRYIVRNGKPVRVPQSLSGALTTKLLSPGAKLRVLAEPFIGRSSRVDESLARFVRRRLGSQFLDNLIDPFIAGVYAGDPEQLSLVHALPRMVALEQQYGSLIKGAIFGGKERRARNASIAGEPRMFSFDGGLRVLPDTLEARLDGAVRLNCPVSGIDRDGVGWRITSPAGRHSYASVLMCAPPHRFASLDTGLDTGSDLVVQLESFEQIYYPPIARLAFGFRRGDVAHPLDGFGALMPRNEHRSILGVLFSSSMFENRAPHGHVLLTAFAGGARDPHVGAKTEEQITDEAIRDLRFMLGITGAPVFRNVVKIERSIPQYNVGYGAVKELIRRTEARCPGLYFGGNYCQGISVADCIAGGGALAERIAANLSRQAVREVAHVS